MEAVYRGIWVSAYRDLLRFVQERSRIVSTFTMPLLYLLVFGMGLDRTVGAVTPGVSFAGFLLPGVIAMNAVQISLATGTWIVFERRGRLLRELLVSPLSRGGIVLGKAASSAVIAVAQGIVLLVFAPFLGVSLDPLTIAKLLLLVVILSLALSGFSVLVAARMRSQQGFQAIMQFSIVPLTFTTGVFFPVNNVPLPLQVLAKTNPATYGVDAVRRVFLSATTADQGALGVSVFGYQMSILEDTLVIALIGLALLAAAVWSFDRQEDTA